MKNMTKKKPKCPNQREQRLNLKPKRTKRKKDNIDLICEECRGYKFCASRSRDYPCLCFTSKNER